VDRGTEVALRLTAGALSADTVVHTMTPAMTSFIWRPRLTQVIASMQRIVSGVVVDSGNVPIRGAQLTAHGRSLATTNDRGRFSFRVPAHDTTILDVRRIGYMAVRTPIMDGADTTIMVTMLPAVQILAGVDVSERRAATARLSGFEERLANWKHAATMQYFITAEDIAKRGAALITSVLGDVPGLSLATVSRGGQKVTVVLGHDRGRGGSCRPNIYIDGHRFDQMDDPEGIIGVIRPQDIAGIEIYPNITDAPVQYQALNGWCAIILIWSKGAK
jgi:hypothetical protein